MWLYDPPCPTAQASKLACALHKGKQGPFCQQNTLFYSRCYKWVPKEFSCLRIIPHVPSQYLDTRVLPTILDFLLNWPWTSFSKKIILFVWMRYPPPIPIYCVIKYFSFNLYFFFFFYSSVKECSLRATWKDLFFFLSLHLCLKTYCLLYFCSDGFLLKLQM